MRQPHLCVSLFICHCLDRSWSRFEVKLIENRQSFAALLWKCGGVVYLLWTCGPGSSLRWSPSSSAAESGRRILAESRGSSSTTRSRCRTAPAPPRPRWLSSAEICARRRQTKGFNWFSGELVARDGLTVFSERWRLISATDSPRASESTEWTAWSCCCCRFVERTLRRSWLCSSTMGSAVD